MHYKLTLHNGDTITAPIKTVAKWADIDQALSGDGFFLIRDNEYINLKYVVSISIEQES